ncbi:TetR family transcriptional regulator [Neisseriaceae bacterium JH1-16]|nr:TetR family transcriptional regulator [Neisseriaceae bacterium JH1-16]
MVRRTREEAEQTRLQLLETAQVLFWEKGVSRTSLADIAQAAGVTRGAIYWHFANKADLFNAMCDLVQPEIDEMHRRLCEEARAAPAQTLWRHCCEMLYAICTIPKLTRIVGILHLRCEYVGEMELAHLANAEWLRENHQRFQRLFEYAADCGELMPGIDPYMAALSLQGQLRGLVEVWLLRPEALDLARDAERLLSPYFSGVFRPGSWHGTTD